MRKREPKIVRASGKLEQTLWVLEKDEVDQFDGNKEPIVYGFADLGFLNSRLESPSFGISARGTLT